MNIKMDPVCSDKCWYNYGNLIENTNVEPTDMISQGCANSLKKLTARPGIKLESPAYMADALSLSY